MTNPILGTFIAKDKFGNQIVFEWGKIDSQSSSFAEKLKSFSDIVAQTYTPVEVEFLKKYPTSVSANPFYKPVEPLLAQGIEKADWNLIEEKMHQALKQIGELDVTQGLKTGDVYYFVIAKDKATEEPLGIIHFLVKSENPGSVRSPVFGVVPAAQGRGIGKLLMSSIFKIIPDTKQINLCTRVTNETAINAYRNWGFMIDLNPEKEAWLTPEHWTSLEYNAEKVNTLQECAEKIKMRSKMKDKIDLKTLKLDDETQKQINQCLNLVKEIFGKDLLGVYLYGSALLGGLQKYSDIDLFVVSDRSTTDKEKISLVTQLLKISGVYMKSTKRPIEITIVNKAEINPWYYPPNFDFQYGEWLRSHFERGVIEPWSTKEMPDLALLITHVLLASKTLFGANPDELFCTVPYNDFVSASVDALQNLMSELDSDTRNVLLTLVRTWSTVETDAIRTKTAAADWAIDRLPKQYRPVMKRAKLICKGEEQEHWDDIQELIKPCADFIKDKINNKVIEIKSSNNATKSITLAK